jgi:glycyl-tRNA synthetase
MPELETKLTWLADRRSRVVESDRLPKYSDSTIDIEVLIPSDNGGRWTEIASISIRNDFGPNTKVLEIAVGLDRIVDIFNLPHT